MTTNDDWRGDWQTAEEGILRAGLLATPEQRLEWLEAALELARATRSNEAAARQRRVDDAADAI